MSVAVAQPVRKAQVKSVVDEETKLKATELYESIGMSLSTAINVFLRQSIAEGRMPFTPGYPEPPRVNWSDSATPRAEMRNGIAVVPSSWKDDDDDEDWA